MVRPRFELTASPRPVANPVAIRGRHILLTLLMTALLGLGVFLRIQPSSGFHHAGYDEHGYMMFVKQVQTVGLWNYDAVVQAYIERQYQRPDAVVPATRISFLAPAAAIAEFFHLDEFRALRTVAATASILLLGLSALFAYRLGGIPAMIGVTALIATAPLQIHLSQRALIDGYFAFWAIAALWLVWENLQHPGHRGWLYSYSLCLTILVLTKENAAFVVFAIFALLLLNRFLRFGVVTPHLLVATIVGPLLAILILGALAGGLWEWVQFNRMFVAKSRTNFYSVIAQDGPWYRYLVDFVILWPLPVTFACGHIFQLRERNRADLFMATFLCLSIGLMSTVRYGMSLRYAAFCEVPLAWLACSQVFALARRVSRWRAALATIILLGLALSGLQQYRRFFVDGAIYDPTTAALVRSAGMEKSPPTITPSVSAGAESKTTHP